MRLLIIGNGFDLNAGLKTKFSDFITKEKIEYWYNSPSECPNFLYLLFSIKFFNSVENGFRLFSRDTNNECLWMDIESFIKELCTGKIPNFYLNISGDHSYFSLFKFLYEKRANLNYLNSAKDANRIIRFFHRKFPNTPQNSNINVQNYLLKELNKFEDEFCAYLTTAIANNIDYRDKATALFFKLGVNYLSGHYIIDFNYTHDNDCFGEVLASSEINFIHGSIKRGAIIGFDSSNTSNLQGVVLSKAWQKMSADYVCTELPNIDDNNEVEIKFFGHSLGQQDYAYFHAIFDKYDIYNKKVILTFIYDKYGKTDEENEEIESTYLQSVYRLINNYAQRSGKEGEFKTIISRLQMENRLHIYLLGDYSKKHDISKLFAEAGISK